MELGLSTHRDTRYMQALEAVVAVLGHARTSLMAELNLVSTSSTLLKFVHSILYLTMFNIKKVFTKTTSALYLIIGVLQVE